MKFENLSLNGLVKRFPEAVKANSELLALREIVAHNATLIVKNSKKDLSKKYGLSEDDDRLERFQEEIKEQGFCSADLWCLYRTIASFVLPRLKDFARYGNAICEPKKSDRLFKSMVWSFEYVLSDIDHIKNGKEKSKKVQDREYKRFLIGMKNFSENFLSLWT